MRTLWEAQHLVTLLLDGGILLYRIRTQDRDTVVLSLLQGKTPRVEE